MATTRGNQSPMDPSEPRDPAAAHAVPGRRRPARDVGEALERARRHGRAAGAESLAMLHALVEAAALAATGRGPEYSGILSPVAKLLEGMSDELAAGFGEPPARTLGAIAAAIDAEITRWEARANADPDARTVLRAFLGLREILWEFGVRPDASPDAEPTQRRRHAPTPRPRKPNPVPRVQRVPVQG